MQVPVLEVKILLSNNVKVIMCQPEDENSSKVRSWFKVIQKLEANFALTTPFGAGDANYSELCEDQGSARSAGSYSELISDKLFVQIIAHFKRLKIIYDDLAEKVIY